MDSILAFLAGHVIIAHWRPTPTSVHLLTGEGLLGTVLTAGDCTQVQHFSVQQVTQGSAHEALCRFRGISHVTLQPLPHASWVSPIGLPVSLGVLVGAEEASRHSHFLWLRSSAYSHRWEHPAIAAERVQALAARWAPGSPTPTCAIPLSPPSAAALSPAAIDPTATLEPYTAAFHATLPRAAQHVQCSPAGQLLLVRGARAARHGCGVFAVDVPEALGKPALDLTLGAGGAEAHDTVWQAPGSSASGPGAVHGLAAQPALVLPGDGSCTLRLSRTREVQSGNSGCRAPPAFAGGAAFDSALDALTSVRGQAAGVGAPQRSVQAATQAPQLGSMTCSLTLQLSVLVHAIGVDTARSEAVADTGGGGSQIPTHGLAARLAPAARARMQQLADARGEVVVLQRRVQYTVNSSVGSVCRRSGDGRVLLRQPPADLSNTTWSLPSSEAATKVGLPTSALHAHWDAVEFWAVAPPLGAGEAAEDGFVATRHGCFSLLGIRVSFSPGRPGSPTLAGDVELGLHTDSPTDVAMLALHGSAMFPLQEGGVLPSALHTRLTLRPGVAPTPRQVPRSSASLDNTNSPSTAHSGRAVFQSEVTARIAPCSGTSDGAGAVGNGDMQEQASGSPGESPAIVEVVQDPLAVQLRLEDPSAKRRWCEGGRPLRVLPTPGAEPPTATAAGITCTTFAVSFMGRTAAPPHAPLALTLAFPTDHAAVAFWKAVRGGYAADQAPAAAPPPAPVRATPPPVREAEVPSTDGLPSQLGMAGRRWVELERALGVADGAAVPAPAWTVVGQGPLEPGEAYFPRQHHATRSAALGGAVASVEGRSGDVRDPTSVLPRAAGAATGKLALRRDWNILLPN